MSVEFQETPPNQVLHWPGALRSRDSKLCAAASAFEISSDGNIYYQGFSASSVSICFTISPLSG